MKSKTLNLIIFIFTMLIFYIPILTMMVFSVNSGKSAVWEGFSLKWYALLFAGSPKIWSALGNSMLIGILSSATSTLIGTLGAWAVWHRSLKWRKFLLSLSYMPLMLPDLIIGISLLTLFVMLSFPLGLETIFIAHTTMNIPFSMLLILSVLEESDLSILEAAKDLGANEFQTWTKILLPIIAPGLTASFFLTLMLSLDDFAITFFVSGSGSTTLPMFVYSSIRFGVSPALNALSVLIVGVSLIVFSFNKKIGRMLIK